MASHTIFSKYIATTELTSIQKFALVDPPQQGGCCRCDSSPSLPFSSRALGDQRFSSLRHFCKRNRGTGGRQWAMAGWTGGQLSLLSSSGLADQNERLKDAAKAGDLQTLNELLGLSDVSINLPSSSRAGWTALHLACFYGHPSVVKSLLKAGANLEVRNNSGNTPLQLASLKGNVGIAQMLLESGADFYAESFDRGTALEYAQEWGGDEIVDFLLLWAARSNKKL